MFAPRAFNARARSKSARAPAQSHEIHVLIQPRADQLSARSGARATALSAAAVARWTARSISSSEPVCARYTTELRMATDSQAQAGACAAPSVPTVALELRPAR